MKCQVLNRCREIAEFQVSSLENQLIQFIVIDLHRRGSISPISFSFITVRRNVAFQYAKVYRPILYIRFDLKGWLQMNIVANLVFQIQSFLNGIFDTRNLPAVRHSEDDFSITVIRKCADRLQAGFYRCNVFVFKLRRYQRHPVLDGMVFFFFSHRPVLTVQTLVLVR